jgi:hypothetical protein
MSVVATIENFENRNFKLSTSGEGSRTRSFWAFVDSLQNDSAYVVANCAVDALWTPYGGSNTYQLESLEAVQDKTFPYKWNVTASYSNRAEEKKDNKSDGKDAGGNDKGETPEEDMPLYDTTWSPYLEPAAQDENGLKVANSAGDPFLPAVMVQKWEQIIRITKNIDLKNFNRSKLNAAMGGVNQNPLKIDNQTIATQTGKITGISSTRMIKNGKIYYRCNFEIRIRPNWFTKLLDCGANEIVGGVKRPIIKNGVRVRVWALTNGQASDTPDVLTFDFNTKVDFGGLGIS